MTDANTADTDALGRTIVARVLNGHVARDDRGHLTVVCPGLPARRVSTLDEGVAMLLNTLLDRM